MMIRAYEKDVSWQAGALAIAVHLALLGALLLSFNWKATQPLLNVAEVELWDSLPQPESPPVVTPVEPPAPVQEAPPPVPEKVAPEPEPVKPPAVDIALEKKRKEQEQKKAAEQIKKDLALEQKKQLAALQAEARHEEMQNSDKLLKENKANEALKKLQQEALAEEQAQADQAAKSAKSAANASLLDEYRGKIQAKIRGNVNKTLCGTGNPELKFDIALLSTGELSGLPKLLKSSGSKVCDEAVERAIMASQPLPLPTDGSVFAQFRNLKLTFRPND